MYHDDEITGVDFSIGIFHIYKLLAVQKTQSRSGDKLNNMSWGAVQNMKALSNIV